MVWVLLVVVKDCDLCLVWVVECDFSIFWVKLLCICCSCIRLSFFSIFARGRNIFWCVSTFRLKLNFVFLKWLVVSLMGLWYVCILLWFNEISVWEISVRLNRECIKLYSRFLEIGLRRCRVLCGLKILWFYCIYLYCFFCLESDRRIVWIDVFWVFWFVCVCNFGSF